MRWLQRAFVALLLLAPGVARAEEVVDGIAAQVGNDIVLVSEVTQLTAAPEKQMRAAGASDADIARMRSDVLERLIERRLLEQVVKKAELDATDAEVQSAIDGIAKDNHLTLDQLKRSVEGGGLSWDAYRERIRGEIQRAKVLNGMVRSHVRLDDKEVRTLYDQRYAHQPKGGVEYHLRHILVTFGGATKRDEATACGQVQKALGRIKDGESFSDVARELSEMNPEQGGDVGWVPAQNLAGWMGPVVSSLEPGQTSDVVRMPFGCNLFQLVEKRDYKPLTWEQARDQLRAELFEKKTQEEYEKFMDKLRSQTYIDRKGAFATTRLSLRPGPTTDATTDATTGTAPGAAGGGGLLTP